MGFHTTGDLSYGKTRTFRHLCPSACTQQFQASGRQHTSTALLVLVSVLFLSWYRPIYFFLIWIGGGVFTFLFGKSGWHIGSSGLIYGLAFFLFFSGIFRKHVPLIALSLLITFLYGGLVWNMFPQFAKVTTSWEGHMGGAIAGMLCAVGFIKYGPQRPDPFADEENEEEDNSVDETEEKSPDEKEKTDSIETEKSDNEGLKAE